MPQWIDSIMNSLGYAGIALLVFLENIVPPIPSELVLPAAGFAAQKGEMTLWGVIVAATVGAVIGALPWYFVGRYFGPEALKRWVDRHGKWLTLTREEVDRADAWFDRYGSATVFFCRMVPGVRTLVSLPAGFTRMPLGKFLLYTTLGSAGWSALLVWLGYQLREQFPSIGPYVSGISAVVLGAMVVWYLVRLARRWNTDPKASHPAG